MECSICLVRSSVGYCSACQILLCDECGISCTKCGKLVCSQHVHETRSHKQLCPECMEERKTRAAERAAVADAGESTSLEALQEEQPADVASEALLASVRQPPPPWKLSAITAGAGVAVMLVLLFFPAMRHVDLPGTAGLLYIPYFVMLVPLIAIAWGIAALTGADYVLDRPKAYIGLGLSIVCIIMGVVAVQTDPARKAAEAARIEAERLKSATPEEIKAKREGVLNRFK
ncbi:MAG: hypothetical protein HZB26_17050 [Candidatus Hydrogenedentes bacterium]|nr:hypothetical protein [Candidatus Hydrogenedentota bacterium]